MKRTLKKGQELISIQMKDGYFFNLHMRDTVVDVDVDGKTGIISTDLTCNLNVRSKEAHCIEDTRQFKVNADNLTTFQIDCEQIAKEFKKVASDHHNYEWQLKIKVDTAPFVYAVSVRLEDFTMVLTNTD